MIAILSDEECVPYLQAELGRRFPKANTQLLGERLCFTDAPAVSSGPLMFCRQALPGAESLTLPSINAWAKAIVERMLARLPHEAPWRLHLAALYGDGKAGSNRLRLIAEAVRGQLQLKRRSLLRSLVESDLPFSPDTSLVQLMLTSPEDGVLAVTPAVDLQAARHLVTPFVKGELPVAEDKSAPSRAFAKLVEAQQRLGRHIQSGETCVDLGASPGGWSYVALNQGAAVTAIDRTPLRDDLMAHKRLTFIKGDAFRHQPDQPVDWMLCDVIALPERSIENLLHWARSKWMRHFVVSIKFKGDTEYEKIDRLAKDLPEHCSELLITQLNANKNEACAIGTLR